MGKVLEYVFTCRPEEIVAALEGWKQRRSRKLFTNSSLAMKAECGRLTFWFIQAYISGGLSPALKGVIEEDSRGTRLTVSIHAEGKIRSLVLLMLVIIVDLGSGAPVRILVEMLFGLVIVMLATYGAARFINIRAFRRLMETIR